MSSSSSSISSSYVGYCTSSGYESDTTEELSSSDGKVRRSAARALDTKSKGKEPARKGRRVRVRRRIRRVTSSEEERQRYGLSTSSASTTATTSSSTTTSDLSSETPTIARASATPQSI